MSIINFSEFIFESAPRLPKDENYWLKKGKTGKNVCLITHDDMDGIVSAIVMKNYLVRQGFKIKKYGIINYQEGWEAFQLDDSLINIALDFAEDNDKVDFYVDHHGKFDEELQKTQKRFSIKTRTGSAAEGIAQQLGMPFSKDTKDWIDMIDSAKYSEYDIDIKGILELDISEIKKSNNAKLKFAASVNQLLKRSDHKTIIEVINASEYPSIFNIFRLFKIFYPKNNPDWRSGEQPDFVESGKDRIFKMQKMSRGDRGYNLDGTKIIYNNQNDFIKEFAINIDGKFKLEPKGYQIIGNLMYMPSGTWSNALRAKSIYSNDIDNGILPDDPKRNFVLLQYGNTLQIADLNTKIKLMNVEDLPRDKNDNPITNLGKYCDGLVENFKKYLGYSDSRTVSGGHDGIGTVSNIFGTCNVEPYVGVKFLDMFKNKMINDLSGLEWKISMPWNEVETEFKIRPDEINKKLLDLYDVRNEEEVLNEQKELEILNYMVDNTIIEEKYLKLFKNKTVKKLYEIWLETQFSEIVSSKIKEDMISKIYFKKNNKLEESSIFSLIVQKFNLDEIYAEETELRKEQRKELKRIFKTIFDIYNDKYLKDDTDDKFEKWKKPL